jgi:hypothetical protein
MSGKDIKLVTTTEVRSEPAAPEDYEEMEMEKRRKRPRSPVGRWSEDTSGSRALSFKMEEFGSRQGTPRL